MSDFLGESEDSQEGDTGIDLTPMLDVTFIMLIFFIVTASFVKQAGIDVELPNADTAVSQDAATIMIAISKEGEIWINNGQVEPRDVAHTVKQLHAQSPRGAVLVKTARTSEFKKLDVVLDALDEAGIEKVAVATASSGSG